MLESFSVCQFFSNDTHKYVKRCVKAQEAVDTVVSLCMDKSAQLGNTIRVIITDSEDCINFEWQYGVGIVYPKLVTEVVEQHN